MTSVGWEEGKPIHLGSSLLVVGDISGAVVNQTSLDLNPGQGSHNRGREKQLKWPGARLLSGVLRCGKEEHYNGKKGRKMNDE